LPYLVDATDGPDGPTLREALRPRHLAYLDGRLDLLLGAGAKLDEHGRPFGSIYLVDTDARDVVDSFMATDPYVVHGVFASVTVTHWRKGFFDHQRLVPRVDGEPGR
jgi:uncharacterized protein YciI